MCLILYFWHDLWNIYAVQAINRADFFMRKVECEFGFFLLAELRFEEKFVFTAADSENSVRKERNEPVVSLFVRSLEQNYVRAVKSGGVADSFLQIFMLVFLARDDKKRICVRYRFFRYEVFYKLA